MATTNPFTRSVLKQLKTPAAEIQVVMTRLRGDVFKTMREQELPWVNRSLTGEFYPNPVTPIEAEASPQGNRLRSLRQLCAGVRRGNRYPRRLILV